MKLGTLGVPVKKIGAITSCLSFKSDIYQALQNPENNHTLLIACYSNLCNISPLYVVEFSLITPSYDNDFMIFS